MRSTRSGALAAAYREALESTRNETEREFLTGQLAEARRAAGADHPE